VGRRAIFAENKALLVGCRALLVQYMALFAKMCNTLRYTAKCAPFKKVVLK